MEESSPERATEFDDHLHAASKIFDKVTDHLTSRDLSTEPAKAEAILVITVTFPNSILMVFTLF